VTAGHVVGGDAHVVLVVAGPGLGARADETHHGDALRLEQALQNLASNALRHTPHGGDVELRAELNGDDVLISVRDTGTGIPTEHLPFIFDRFYKFDPARAGNHMAGSGLGLSVVKAIVERHGGSVSATSQLEVGTIFTIRLPLGIGSRSASVVPELPCAQLVVLPLAQVTGRL
jgi:signal transduction histidine kinase